MKLKFFVFAFFSLFFFPLFAEEDLFRVDGLGEPTMYINGCINAASGTFMYSFPDIVVEGPEPISFSRHYSSKNSKNFDLGYGFAHNHATKLEEMYRRVYLEPVQNLRFCRFSSSFEPIFDLKFQG